MAQRKKSKNLRTRALPQEPIKRALLVGINYRGTSSELHGCINDVQGIKDILINVYNFQPENILLMTDDTPCKPNYDEIAEGFRWLVSKSPADKYKACCYSPFLGKEKGSLFFHYSGHGSRLRDDNNDEPDGYDETLCPLDCDTKGFMRDDFVRTKLVDRVPASCKLFSIIDACHSASSFDLQWTLQPQAGGKFSLVKANNQTSSKGQVIMLSGCQDEQTSADTFLEGKAQGALTYAVISVLRANNFKITYEKLLSDVCSLIAEKKLSRQIPCLSSGQFIDLTQSLTL